MALMKFYGINGLPALHRVFSLDFSRSFPWEWMHLFLENICTNLVDLWTRRFKGLDEGFKHYELAPHIWEQVRCKTAEAVKDIPASFVRILTNIATDHGGFTAESWCFWFVHIAPIVLEGRFHRPKYY